MENNFVLFHGNLTRLINFNYAGGETSMLIILHDVALKRFKVVLWAWLIHNHRYVW